MIANYFYQIENIGHSYPLETRSIDILGICETQLLEFSRQIINVYPNIRNFLNLPKSTLLIRKQNGKPPSIMINHTKNDRSPQILLHRLKYGISK